MDFSYNDTDRALYDMLPHTELTRDIDFSHLTAPEDIQYSVVHYPEEDYTFLHECAAIEYHGVLFAAWYNNPTSELTGRTPIRERRSYDGGKTWSSVRTIADDPSGKILYCPPVFGIVDDRLYLLLNEMVSADHIHALDLYIFSEEADSFVFLRSLPIPFKLNTNVIHLSSGKLMLPGRIAEPDGFPNTPAVLISDSGKIDAPWRLVKIAENGDLPDGRKLVHPEICPIVDGNRILMFCRNDESKLPLVYLSEDEGESWSGPVVCDIPFSSSKIYAGTLSNGRRYCVGNLAPDRRRLMLLLSLPGEEKFSGAYLLHDGYSETLGFGGEQWSYPVCFEYNGRLNIIYSGVVKEGKPKYTAACFLSVNCE